MNSDQDVLDSIRDVNLSYMMLAQRLLREDLAAGMFRLGLSGELAAILKDLSLAQVVKLAAIDQSLCLFRFNHHVVLSTLAQAANGVEIAPPAANLSAAQRAEQLA